LPENSKAYETRAEDLESCEEAVKGCLIRKRALQNGLDRLQRGSQLLVVLQGFGWENPRYAELVVRRSHVTSRGSGAGNQVSRIAPGA
jgi:hypothetical protein